MQTPKLITFLLAFLPFAPMQAAILDSTPVEILRRVDQLPSFPGGKEALFLYIAENINTPISTAEHKIHGQVIVKFVVYKDGQVGDVGIMKSLDPLADAEAQRLVKAMPKWVPGKNKGENVNVEMGLPILFDYLAEAVFKHDSLVFIGVDQAAQFPGGQQAMMKFIATKMNYPLAARRQKIQGDVIVKFMIDRTGQVRMPSIVSGLGYGIDEEVIKTLQSMPAWKPAQLNGLPISTQVSNFKVKLRIY